MIQLIFVLVLMIPILAIVLDSPVGRAMAARLERRSLGTGSDDLTAERLSFLEGELERLSGEVQRLEEESQFMQQLLTERSTSEALPPPPGDGDA